MRPPVGASLAILDALRDGPLCVTAVVRETGLSQSNVSNHLGRLRSLGWVTGDRSGRQVLYHITDYFVEQFVRGQERPPRPLGVRARRRIAGELLPRLVAALTTGAEIEARNLTHEALLCGLTWQDLYLLVFTPALWEIGERWRAGSLAVAEEHLASATVGRLMARVHPGGVAGADAPRVLVTCVEGNLHDLGARMVADFFAAAGWRVHFLGANTPTAEIARTAWGADIVALSVCQPEQLPALRAAAAAIRSEPDPSRLEPLLPAGNRHGEARHPTPCIIAGGPALNGCQPSEWGVDMVDRYLPRTLRRLSLRHPAKTGDS